MSIGQANLVIPNGTKYIFTPLKFYSNNSTPNADANSLSNWNSQQDGGGSAPANFENADFYIQANHKYQLSSSLTGGSTSNLYVQIGGALDLNGNTLSTWKTLNLSGTGVSSSGAFYNSSNSTASISVPINLTAAATIKSTGTGGLTLSGAIDNGGYTLKMDVDNASAISGTINGAGDFVKAGTGTLSFNGAGSLTFTNLTINSGKINGQKDITVNGVLNLGPNPNDTDGALDMVISYGDYASGAYTSDSSYNLNDPTALTTATPALKDNTSSYNNLNSYVLLLGPNASTTGTGDVTGKIRRTSFVSGTTYTFGNLNTQLTFTSVGGSAMPTQITVVSTRGIEGLHVDKTNSVKRMYQILRTGGESATRFTVRFPYDDTELNGNTTEDNLVLWDHHIPYSGITPHEHGKTSNSSTSNYVELTNHGYYYLATEGDISFTKYWMISTQISTIPTWLGATNSGSWTSASNWSSGVVPSSGTSIVIPNDLNTPFEPNIASDLTLGTIEIQTGGILSPGTRNITLTGGVDEIGGRGTWINNGTFNAGTGTVIFDKAGATYSGNTAFNNITINADKSLILQNGSILKIGNTLTNNGTLDAASNPNTIEYNGTAEQTTTGLPATVSALTINNAANVALTNPITITSNLTLTTGDFNLNTSTLTLNGPYISGTPNNLKATSASSINFNNTGSTTVTLPDFTAINNLSFNADTMTYNLGNNITVHGDLNITNGTVNSSSYTLNRNEAGGTLTLGNGSFLFIGGTNTLPTNYATHSVNESSTVSYNGESQAVGQLKSSQSYGNLTLSGTGTKTFTDDTDAKISGHFSVEGPTVTPPTKLTFNGTSTQNIAGLPYNNIEFSEAGTKTFTSSASLSPTAEITFSGTPGMVDFDGVNNNLEFVLQSTTEGTARVGNTGNTSNTTGWTLNGQLRAERFVPAKRAWRLLTAPLKGNANNSIYANWQGTTNEGLLLWHPQGGGDTGLAVGPQSNIWSYSGTGWASVTNTNTANLYDGSTNNAYLVFATGSYDSQNISSGADATTVKGKGDLITGDINHTLIANQFKLIGNPYASPIDTEALATDTANSGSKIWLLDPTNGLGAYVTYDGTNWSVPTPSGNDKYIQSGQAFFIRRNSNTFTVKESHKVAGNSNTWFERNANNETNLENSDRIRVLLYKQDTNNWLFADGALAVNSSNGNNNVDDTDATKISNFNESLMFRNGTTNLSIEYRALPQLGDLQPLRLTGTTNGSYQLRLYTENYTNSTIQPYLEDTQTTSIYEIPTDGSEIIVPFEGVVSNSSNPITRFRIVYQTTLSTEDPMNFGVSIYPNPVKNGYLTISLDNYSSNTTYSLTNLLGQQVQSGNLLLLDNLINVNTLQKGVYIINIKQQEKYYSKKLIIN